MFGVRVAVYSEYYWNYVNALCRQNEDFVILKHVLHIRAVALQRIKMDACCDTISFGTIPLLYLHSSG
jgi:hypothetical protein